MSLTTYREVCTGLLNGLDELQDPRYPFPGYTTAAMDRARELLAQPALAEPPVFALQWSENKPPGEECRHDHCTAQTPFGDFLITWKSWKKYDYPTVDETPWGDSWQAFATVEIAKAFCQREFNARIEACVVRTQPPHPTPARLRHCPTHGQQPPEAWGCPECLRELREELAALRTLPADGEVGELVELLRRRGYEHPLTDQARLFYRAATLLQQQAAELDVLRQVARPVAIPGEAYDDDMGPVTWWQFPVEEAPWIGTPGDSDWPGYHTHFTACPPLPTAPKERPHV